MAKTAITAKKDATKKSLDIKGNIGDFRIFRDTTATPERKKMSNMRAMFNVIFPGEAVHVDNEDKNFTYFWLHQKGVRYDEELDLLHDMGYEPVKDAEAGGKWRVHERFRRTPEGYITWAGHVLYAIPADTWMELDEQERRMQEARHNVKGEMSSFSNVARESSLFNKKGSSAFIKTPDGGEEEV